MTTSSQWLKIDEAAKLAGVSRRTIQRWISTGKLSTEVFPRDRRLKLVRLEEVVSVAQKSPTRRKKRASQPVSTTADVYSEVIDEVLRIVYAHTHRFELKLFGDDRPLNLEALRAGPLGRDLRKLAALARGDVREEREIVLERIETVLQLLFWPPMADDYTVPRTFWDTPIGRIMSMAKYRAFEPSDLTSIGRAAERLAVNVATIYRWMDERHLGYVRDESAGRTFVVKQDVDRLLLDSAPFDTFANPPQQAPVNAGSPLDARVR